MNPNDEQIAERNKVLTAILYSRSIPSAAKALLFTLWTMAGGKPGIVTVTPRELANELTFQMGSEVSLSQITHQLRSLEETSPPLIERDKKQIFVFHPMPDRRKAREKKCSEPTLFDALENQNSAPNTDSLTSEKSRAKCREIRDEIRDENGAQKTPSYINTRTTRAVSYQRKEKKRKEEEVRFFAEKDVSEDGKKTTAAIREIIDFAEPETMALREQIARRVGFRGSNETDWEWELSADLVDRITAGILFGIMKRSDLKGLIDEADTKRKRWANSCYDGKSTRWQTVNLGIRDRFRAAGWVWTPVSPQKEPEPAASARRTFNPRPVADWKVMVDANGCCFVQR